MPGEPRGCVLMYDLPLAARLMFHFQGVMDWFANAYRIPLIDILVGQDALNPDKNILMVGVQTENMLHLHLSWPVDKNIYRWYKVKHIFGPPGCLCKSVF